MKDLRFTGFVSNVSFSWGSNHVAKNYILENTYFVTEKKKGAKWFFATQNNELQCWPGVKGIVSDNGTK